MSKGKGYSAGFAALLLLLLADCAATTPLTPSVVTSYSGEICGGEFFGAADRKGEEYPYVFEITQEADDRFSAVFADVNLTDLKSPTLMEKALQEHGYRAVSAKVAGDKFVVQTTSGQALHAISFQGYPLAGNQLELYRVVNGRKVSGFGYMRSTAQCYQAP